MSDADQACHCRGADPEVRPLPDLSEGSQVLYVPLWPPKISGAALTPARSASGKGAEVIPAPQQDASEISNEGTPSASGFGSNS